MAELSTSISIPFPRYDSTRDPLQVIPGPPILWAIREINLQHMPPTILARDGVSEDKLTEEEEDEILRQLVDSLEESLRESGKKEQASTAAITSWIQTCNSRNLDLDIHRLLRWVIYTGKYGLTIVRYLVEVQHAELDKKDILGRSAIFYCRNNYDLLSWIAWHTRLEDDPGGDSGDDSEAFPEDDYEAFPKDLNHQDDYGRTPLHYAVELEDYTTVELLLALGAKIKIKDRGQKSVIDYVQKIQEESWDGSTLISLPIALRKLQTKKLSWSTCSHWAQRGHQYSERIHRLQEELEIDVYKMQEEDSDTESTSTKYCVSWVHVPWTNGILVYAALQWLKRHEKKPYNINPLSHTWLLGVTIPSDPTLIFREPSYKSTFWNNMAYVDIVFPCFVLRTKRWHDDMRAKIGELRKEVADGISEKYIHHERTLEETYYPSLSNRALTARKSNQVVFREYRGTTESTSNGDRQESRQPILTVPQLWIHQQGPYIAFAFPLIDLPPQIMPSFKYSAGILTGIFIAKHISSFGQRQEDFPSVLDIFEEGVVQVLEDVHNHIEETKSSRSSLETEHSYMTRIANIRDELSMIKKIINQQLKILNQFIEDFENTNPESLPFLMPRDAPQHTTSFDLSEIELMEQRWKEVKHSRVEIDEYLKRIEKIDNDAERVEKRIQDQLNLKRIYASMHDARASLIVSTAVIGFTVITIIFAPLAFTTALFALPLETFLRNQVQFNRQAEEGSDGQQATSAYTTRYIGTWFAVAEVVTLAVTSSFVLLCLWFIDDTALSNFWKVVKSSLYAGFRNHILQKLGDGIETDEEQGPVGEGRDISLRTIRESASTDRNEQRSISGNS
ncbi:hypothetical protein F5Y04DRAFT_279974 [Hypomontagnella monticulosa]|nr:hypothetical protein F5Y04DRAFT_279974 [Hypomontagnella monticulosa]